MTEQFDPYYQWLGIPQEEQPINKYRLLALQLFESDEDVIANAADRQMAFIRTFQNGAHSVESQTLLNELSSARVTLLNKELKAEYDQQLRQTLGAREYRSIAPPVPKVPVQETSTPVPPPVPQAPVQETSTPVPPPVLQVPVQETSTPVPPPVPQVPVQETSVPIPPRVLPTPGQNTTLPVPPLAPSVSKQSAPPAPPLIQPPVQKLLNLGILTSEKSKERKGKRRTGKSRILKLFAVFLVLVISAVLYFVISGTPVSVLPKYETVKKVLNFLYNKYKNPDAVVTPDTTDN